MSYDNAEMERGIAQVLSNFNPGDLFDYGRFGVSMQVSEWSVEPLDDVDADRVADHIAGRVGSFRNGRQRPWSMVDEAEIDFYKPNRVFGEFRPLTVECEDCNYVTYRDSASGLKYTKGRCDNCGGNLQQVAFVIVCECGELTDVRPRQCSQHGWDAVRLRRGSPEDMTTWRFACDICQKKCGDFGGECRACGEYQSSPRPLASGGVFYPQRDVLIDIPPVGVDEGEIPYGETWCRILIAAHLGDIDLDADGTTLEAVATKTQTTNSQVEELVEKLGEDKRAEIAETLAGGPPDRDTVVEENRDRVTLASEETEEESSGYSLTAQELFTFLRCTRGYEGDPADVEGRGRHPTTRSLSAYLDDDEFVDKYPQAKLYRDKLSRVNVADAWVVDNFPLLNLVFGFTRGSPNAAETDLRAFDHPYGDDGLAVYGDRSPSEAIVLELDRAAVVDWLVENGVVNEADVPSRDNDAELKRWFLENVDNTETQNPFTGIDDEVTETVYTLVHSLSHSLMGTASEQCGLDSDSISEVVFPTIPAIVLYAQSMEHFALGGMFTLFKTRIHPWIDDAVDHAERCIYDPACSSDEQGAACHACLHASEFTCEYYNNALDRALLVGGDDWEPFVDV